MGTQFPLSWSEMIHFQHIKARSSCINEGEQMDRFFGVAGEWILSIRKPSFLVNAVSRSVPCVKGSVGRRHRPSWRGGRGTSRREGRWRKKEFHIHIVHIITLTLNPKRFYRTHNRVFPFCKAFLFSQNNIASNKHNTNNPIIIIAKHQSNQVGSMNDDGR